MARVLFALFLLAAPSAVAAQETAPIVLVVDGTHGRISTAHLQRELEVVLERSVLRPEDEAAADARLALVVSFARPHRWTIRLVGGLAPVTRTLDVPGPALEELAALAAEMFEPGVSTVEAPFAGPPVPRVSVALHGAILDPFAPSLGPLRVLGTPDVLDPWR
jgi:hypothetical protein